MVNFGMRSSLLAGMITVAIFITPIMIRAIDEIFITVPRGLYESAISLGALRGEISFKVMTRQCMAGIISAILLSFGRSIGDAASVLFTAGYSDHIATSLNQPTATLPLAVFFQAASPFPEVREKAYAAAAILTIIILIISISTRLLLSKYAHHKIKL